MSDGKYRAKPCPNCGTLIDGRAKLCGTCHLRTVAADRVAGIIVPRKPVRKAPARTEPPMKSFEKIHLLPETIRGIRYAYARADEYEKARIRALNKNLELE